MTRNGDWDTLDDEDYQRGPDTSLVPWSDLERALYERSAARQWHAEGAIEGAPIAVWSGPEKSHKSWAAMQLAATTIAGGRWLGRFEIRRGGPAMYLDAEYGEDEFVRRMCRIARGLGHTNVVAVLNSTRHLHSGDLPLDLRNGAFRRVLEDARQRPPAVIIIDPLRNHLRGSENDADVILEAFRAIGALRDAAQCPVLCVHHVNKQGAPTGSRAIATRADLLIEGSDSDSPIYQARGRKLRPRLDPIADPFSVEVAHTHDDNDEIATARVGLKFVSGNEELGELKQKILKALAEEDLSTNALSEKLRRSFQEIKKALDGLCGECAVAQYVGQVRGRSTVLWHGQAAPAP